ncbi:peptide ABC transporter substrate-binding protein [Patescibacteria group bacterium]|nr:peptide ABC transporter substrate-binding protein [Patescibacteria group bacterium]
MISRQTTGIKLINIFRFLKNKKGGLPNFKYPDNFSAPSRFAEAIARRGGKGKLSFAWMLIRKTFAALGRVEKTLVFLLLLALLASSAKLTYNFWLARTILVPTNGGTLTEGIIGNPRYINPLFSQAKDADTDLAKLIFSSLFTPGQNGEIKPDLVQEYDISEDKKTYTIKIKNNVFWHDHENDQLTQESDKILTADDILYTIKAIQNPNYKSSLRGNLAGVESEKIDDWTIKLSLRSPYEPFLQNLTFGILPSHIWRYINSENTPLAQYNVQPIGSGPYIFDTLTKDANGNIVSLTLKKNNEYYGEKPLIEKLAFKFFDNQNSLLAAINSGLIDATAYISEEKEAEIARPDIKKYNFKTPGYFAVFFNQEKAKILTEKNVRLAINYLTDKDKLISAALKNNGQKTETPLPPTLKEYNTQTKVYAFDLPYANTILTNSGWALGENGARTKEFKKETVPPPIGSNIKIKEEKENIPLEFTLTTSDSPELKKSAEVLKEQWQKGGINVRLNILNADEMQSVIRNRDYEALLFGEILSVTPDPFIFWHSSEIKAPGLNLALYSNKDTDKILEELRQTFDAGKKMELLAAFQAQIVDDAPAVFLFNRYLGYWAKTILEGMETKIIVLPADRFASVKTWSLVKKRIWDGKWKFLNF